jgi:hypothetical protein
MLPVPVADSAVTLLAAIAAMASEALEVQYVL